MYKSYPTDRGLTNPVSYCVNCWKEAFDEITLTEESGKVVKRLDFVDAWNNTLIEEPYVTCTECGRQGHSICQLWFKGFAKKFVCKFCTRDRVNSYPNPARNLQRSKLGDHLEQRLKKLLKENPLVRGEQQDITVRVVSIREKNMTTMDGMKEYYADSGEA